MSTPKVSLKSWRVVKLPKGATAQWETNSIPRCPLWIKNNDDFKCTVSALKADGQRRTKLWLEGCGVSVLQCRVYRHGQVRTHRAFASSDFRVTKRSSRPD